MSQVVYDDEIADLLRARLATLSQKIRSVNIRCDAKLPNLEGLTNQITGVATDGKVYEFNENVQKLANNIATLSTFLDLARNEYTRLQQEIIGDANKTMQKVGY
ncbi:hypothetical protein FACS1894125_6350 [Actinomycetota bacterium]|nr:hypothetical protein FACS1894125_6350 [Actinomycetota bacterium]